MDAKRIRSLGPKLAGFLKRFADCFKRSDTRGHLAVYVRGQLSDLPRKNCEPIADAAGIPPRTLQQFLSLSEWDHDKLRSKLQRIVAKEHSGPTSIGIIDETACPKKGEKTPGVQRQWCGATGKTDNCVVTVHLACATDDFHALVDSELFLPEIWSEDRGRCRAADIPDDMVHRPKTRIALELYDRARSNGIVFPWLTFDEGYGKSVGFLMALRERGQAFVAEVPVTFAGWIDPPRVTDRPRSRVGRPAKKKRLVAGSKKFRTARDHLQSSPELRDRPWTRFHVKDGDKGPMVWEAKRIWFHPNGEDDLPLAPLHLVVARNVVEPGVLKYFAADAARETPLEELLRVAFSRWRVERCFEDGKTELGFDHFEGRSYIGMIRHQTIAALTQLFLARVRQEWDGEKNGTDGLPGPHGGLRAGPILVAVADGGEAAPGTHGPDDPGDAMPESPLAGVPPQADAGKARPRRRRPRRTPPLRPRNHLAL